MAVITKKNVLESITIGDFIWDFRIHSRPFEGEFSLQSPHLGLKKLVPIHSGIKHLVFIFLMDKIKIVYWIVFHSEMCPFKNGNCECSVLNVTVDLVSYFF